MKKTTAWILGAAVMMTLAALPGYGQTAQDVLNKMIDAMGGRKALEAIKDTTITGTLEVTSPMALTAPITIYQKEPDKFRLDIDISEYGMTITQAFDGQKAWSTNPQTGAAEEMPDFMTKEFSRQALGNQAFLAPQKLGITYALKPKAKIDDKDYIVLEQTLSDGHKTTFFLDPATYLPYKQQAKSIDQTGGEVDQETFLSNYQKVGGTTVAFSMRVLNNGTEAQKVTISGVTFNSKLEDTLFLMK
jgi:outer membrane lipoprotein-sorting protein